MLERIAAAVEPLKGLNETLLIDKASPDDAAPQLTLTTPRGKFIFRTNPNEGLLVLQSYITGTHQYFFEAESGQWLSVKDGHDLRGLFTRDWLRHCAGCPRLD